MAPSSSAARVELPIMIAKGIAHALSDKLGATREKDLFDDIKKRITSKRATIEFGTELSSRAA